MNFNMYDIVSKIIPGFIVLTVMSLFYGFQLDTNNLTLQLVASYIIGHLNNSVSSWFEDLYYYLWGGKPSIRLLEGKSIWKVRYYEGLNAKNLLMQEWTGQEPTNEMLFQRAMQYANMKDNVRIKEFLDSYIFSRNLILSVVISAVFLNIKYWFNIQLAIGASTGLVVIWITAKQRGYYYAREVLKHYCQIKFQQSDSVKD